MDDILTRIARYDFVQLCERRALGAINFAGISAVVERTIQIAKELASVPTEPLTPVKRDEISKQAGLLEQKFRELLEFDIEGRENPKGHRDDLMRSTWSKCEEFSNLVIPVIPYLTYKSSEATTESFNQMMQSLKERVESEVGDLEHKKAELDTIIQVARDTAAQTGIAQHAVRFETLAASHQQDSNKWLMATLALLTLTILVSAASLYFFPATGELKDAATLQRIITKVFIVSTVFYGTLWAAKNYRTHRHLSVVNLHRHNALQTFETFVAAAGGDQQTKNAVLLEATRCIFSPANTGYIGSEEDNPSSRIIEIVQSLGAGTTNK